jgi:hypothetical protein
MSRSFLTRRQQRAVELGADKLHELLEWVLRNRPRALRNARLRYHRYCVSQLRKLDRSERAAYPHREQAA